MIKKICQKYFGLFLPKYQLFYRGETPTNYYIEEGTGKIFFKNVLHGIGYFRAPCEASEFIKMKINSGTLEIKS